MFKGVTLAAAMHVNGCIIVLSQLDRDIRCSEGEHKDLFAY